MVLILNSDCDCHEYAECLEFFGDFSCQCLDGFIGDGNQCVELLIG